MNQRLRKRGKPGKVRVMAAMHKPSARAFGVLKSGTPYAPPTPPIANTP